MTSENNKINYDISHCAMEELFVNLIHKYIKKSITRSKMKVYISNCRENAKKGLLKNYLDSLQDV